MMERLSDRSLGFVSALLLLVTGTAPAPGGENVRPAERQVASRIDAVLRNEAAAGTLPPLATDEQFLRRAMLDLAGQLPDAETLNRFRNDPGPDRRAQLIERLLASPAYATNWGRYWRDVVTYHTPASANYLRWQLFDRWWVTQIEQNRPWDQVVTTLVTATGVNDEIAPVNYLTALYGNQVEVAATTARVFLGVQLQCAECHDAKTESWKREQFHEFAAFFGRARLVQHKDVDGRGTPYAIEGRADGQYLMSDKKKPDRLVPMQPRFLTGETVSIDAPDEERRAVLARLLTSPTNPWFARCHVNRVWTCLMGWGFYPSVNDLGTDPRLPEVLDLLANGWVASGYDMKWLLRTIMLTDAYQRQWQPAADRDDAVVGVCPTRMRPEQVFEALRQALGFDENDKNIPAPAPSSAPAVQRHTGLRNMVVQAFKENPSLPFAEIHGTIPQALLMMNSQLVHVATSATNKTYLAGLIAQGHSDAQIVNALYDRTLVRKPTAEELRVCTRYLARVGNRSEALEDIYWSLVNSTEFLTKR